MHERDLWMRHAERLRVPRAFVIDVDGTLLDSRHRITEQTRAAVSACVAMGTEVVLASSRPPLALLPVLRELGLESASFIASQGAVLGRRIDEQRFSVMRQEPIPLDVAHKIAARAARVGVTVNWFTNSAWFASTFDVHVRAEARVVGLRPEVRAINSLDEPPGKLMFMSDVPGMARRLDLPAQVQATESNPGYLEVTRAGVSKGSALQIYCDVRGIAPSEVAAVGDGLNDLELFEMVGTSIAPANAAPEVLRQATLRTRSNDENGVALAIEFLMGLSALPPV